MTPVRLEPAEIESVISATVLFKVNQVYFAFANISFSSLPQSAFYLLGFALLSFYFAFYFQTNFLFIFSFFNNLVEFAWLVQAFCLSAATSHSSSSRYGNFISVNWNVFSHQY